MLATLMSLTPPPPHSGGFTLYRMCKINLFRKNKAMAICRKWLTDFTILAAKYSRDYSGITVMRLCGDLTRVGG